MMSGQPLASGSNRAKLWVGGRQELTSSSHRALGAGEKLAEKYMERMKRRKLGLLRCTEHKSEADFQPSVELAPLCAALTALSCSLLIFKPNNPHASSPAFPWLQLMAPNTFCERPELDICEQLNSSRPSTRSQALRHEVMLLFFSLSLWRGVLGKVEGPGKRESKDGRSRRAAGWRFVLEAADGSRRRWLPPKGSFLWPPWLSRILPIVLKPDARAPVPGY